MSWKDVFTALSETEKKALSVRAKNISVPLNKWSDEDFELAYDSVKEDVELALGAIVEATDEELAKNAGDAYIEAKTLNKLFKREAKRRKG